MTTARQENRKYTSAEYLQLERNAEHKNELFDGEISAMSRASFKQNVISINLLAFFHSNLKGTGCRPFASDMRIHVPANGLYTYPDLSVVCGQEEFLDEEFDTLLNPMLIGEVLSPSTSDYDAGRKFTLYRSIPTLTEYLLIPTTEQRVQQFVRSDTHTWIMREYIGLETEVLFENWKLALPLVTLYEGVTFNP